MDVSRETREKLDIYQKLLLKWQTKINLVSSKTMGEFWIRHVADSLQLLDYADNGLIWADIGSGGGFPGMVLAIALSNNSQSLVNLIETDARKCVFLNEVARATGAQVVVHNLPAAKVLQSLNDVEVITSRAVTAVAKLVQWSEVQLERGAVGLFLKGQHVEDELTSLPISSKFFWNVLPGLAGTSSYVVQVRHQLANR
jgi:16S rRNA (guanine527-N7)-methyltransferase